MGIRVCTHGYQGLYTWVSGFVHMGIRVCTHGYQGLDTWVSGFGQFFSTWYKKMALVNVTL